MTDLEKVRAIYQACKLLADATDEAWEWIYGKMPARVVGEVRSLYKRAGTLYGNNSTGEVRWMAEIGEGQ